jgi:hypothetical protein
MNQRKLYLFLALLLACFQIEAAELNYNFLLANPMDLPTFTKAVQPLVPADFASKQIIKISAESFVVRWWATGYKNQLIGLVGTPSNSVKKFDQLHLELDATSILKENFMMWGEKTPGQKIYAAGLYAYEKSTKEELEDQELFKQRANNLYSCMQGGAKIQASIRPTFITKLTIADGFQLCSEGVF